MSLCPFACPAPQCKYSEALMRKYRPLSLSLSATHIQPPSLTDFMDVRCLTFSPVEPLSPPLPCFIRSFLPSFLTPFPPPCRLLSGVPSRLAGLAVTLDFKERLHSSVTHQRARGPFSAALKEREGTRSECIKREERKAGVRVYERRARGRKRIRS